jgi:hypothetical protein
MGDENRRNMDLVLEKGMPCTVECEYIEPAEWGVESFQQYGRALVLLSHLKFRLQSNADVAKSPLYPVTRVNAT